MFASCTSTPTNFNKIELFEFPSKDEILVASLGETLVLKGVEERGPAFQLSKGRIDTYGDGPVFCKRENYAEQTMFIKNIKSNGDECAGPFKFNTVDRDGAMYGCSGKQWILNICYSNEMDNFYIDYPGVFNSHVVNPHLIKRTEKITTTTTNFKQQFIYNGKVDNNLSFIYREFSGDMIRPSFTQTVQYDLNESKIIVYKKLRINIIEVSNQIIKYKVIDNF